METLRPGTPRGVWHNRLRAAWPGPAQAVADGSGWRASDVFRRAQVHFDVQRRLLEVRAAGPPSLMHWTYPVPLAFGGAANVYTIHDLIPLTHPSLTDIDPARFARLLRVIARRADHIVTVSEASRRNIVTLLGVDERRVTNTGQPAGIAPELRHDAPPLQRGHFLFCGTIERRKNIARLIAAHRTSGTARPLILAGPDGFGAAAELADAGARAWEAMPPGGAPGVWRAAYLPRPVVLELMRGARALFLPSLAEGFGRPIAEAMALGVPVLTSLGGATEEVAGGAALLIDPHDVGAMARWIVALSGDDALCGRLADAGLRRADEVFSQASLARLTAVYKHALQVAL